MADQVSKMNSPPGDERMIVRLVLVDGKRMSPRGDDRPRPTWLTISLRLPQPATSCDLAAISVASTSWGAHEPTMQQKINSPHRPASREKDVEASINERVWVHILAADHKCCEKPWAEFAAPLVAVEVKLKPGRCQAGEVKLKSGRWQALTVVWCGRRRVRRYRSGVSLQQ